MVKHTKAQSFKISKLKKLLEKPWNPPEVTRICNSSKSKTWFKIKVSQLKSSAPVKTQWIVVLQICSNECWIKARWINDKCNNIFKTKIKETIHMLFFTISNLKNAKIWNHDEYCYHLNQFILASANFIVISIFFSYTLCYTFHCELTHCTCHVSFSFLLISLESSYCPFK